MNELIKTTIFMAQNSVCTIDGRYCSGVCTACIKNDFHANVSSTCAKCIFYSWKYADTLDRTYNSSADKRENINKTIQLISSKQIP